jgi:hypothetical protein
VGNYQASQPKLSKSLFLELHKISFENQSGHSLTQLFSIIREFLADSKMSQPFQPTEEELQELAELFEVNILF